MSTNNYFFKAASIAILVLLGLGLTACGKKTEPAKEQYVYDATYEKVSTLVENGYCGNSEVTEDYINFIVTKYDKNDNEYYIKKYDIKSKTEEFVKLNDKRLMESAYIDKFHVYNDGSIGVIVGEYDEATMESKYSFTVFSANGDLVSDVEIKMDTTDSYFYMSNVFFNEDKTLYILSSSSIYKIDNSGKILKQVSVDYWIEDMAVTPAGKIYVVTYLDSGEAICPVSDDFSGLESKLEVTFSNGKLYSCSDKELLISTDASLKLYNIETKETETVWNWLDVDVNDSDIKTITRNEDGTYTVISDVWSENFQGIEFARIEKKEVEPGKEKTLVVYGCKSMDSYVKEAIRAFNRSSSEYKITVKCYEDETDDYDVINERMGTDIAQGNIDIIELSYGVEYKKLVNSKALACLDDYYKRDINEADYFSNIFDAYKVNDKQYCVISNANISTLAMSRDYTGGKGSITLDELIEIRKNNPDKELMSYADKETLFYICLVFTISDYVNFDDGTCNFNNDNFYKIMEFANTFPSSEEKEYNFEEYDEWAMMQSGEVIMTILYLSDTDSLQLYSQLMKGGLDITGYPVSNGSGNVIDTDCQYAIAEKSKVKDGAWEFLKSLLEGDNQYNSYYNGFPVLKAAFDDKMKREMNSEGISTWGNGHTEVTLEKFTQEKADIIRNLVEHATNTTEYDSKMFEIIDEEMSSYFSGQKSAKDVAQIIQDRVTIYLAESR